MFKKNLKTTLQTCDKIKIFLENVLTENDESECRRNFFAAMVYTNEVKEFIYANYMFFDNLYSIDGLVDDFNLFIDEKLLSNIKGIARPCISQLSGVKNDLIKSELIYDELNNLN